MNIKTLDATMRFHYNVAALSDKDKIVNKVIDVWKRRGNRKNCELI